MRLPQVPLPLMGNRQGGQPQGLPLHIPAPLGAAAGVAPTCPCPGQSHCRGRPCACPHGGNRIVGAGLAPAPTGATARGGNRKGHAPKGLAPRGCPYTHAVSSSRNYNPTGKEGNRRACALRRPSSVVRGLSSVVCRPLSVVCRPSSVVPQQKSPHTGARSGEGGIRTHGAFRLTRSPGARVRPDYATSPP